MPSYVHVQCAARILRVSPLQLSYSHSWHARAHYRISLVCIGAALGMGWFRRLCWVFWDASGWA